MILDRAERITIKATVANHFVLIAIRDGKPFYGAAEFDGGMFEFAKLLRDDFGCPVMAWFGNRWNPRGVEFSI